MTKSQGGQIPIKGQGPNSMQVGILCLAIDWDLATLGLVILPHRLRIRETIRRRRRFVGRDGAQLDQLLP